MSRRVAVVADAVSRDAIFPYWHRYYGRLFGVQSLYIITYSNLAAEFRDVCLGGIIELPAGYEDSLRQKVIANFVTTLLECFDVVIRVDIDEFLVVDPRSSPSLASYVMEMSDAYVTARGFDVIHLADEAPIGKNPTEPLLLRRSYAYPNSALNKTAIITSPMKWSTGFHWCSVYPNFGPLFMLHMKRLDIDWQVAWLTRMYEAVKDNPSVGRDIKNYYMPDRARVENYHRDVGLRPRMSGIEGWYRDDTTRDFLRRIKYDVANGLYSGEYGHEHVLCEIIPEWREIL